MKELSESQRRFEASYLMKNANLGKTVSQLKSEYANPLVELMWIGWNAAYCEISRNNK